MADDPSTSPDSSAVEPSTPKTESQRVIEAAKAAHRLDAATLLNTKNEMEQVQRTLRARKVGDLPTAPDHPL